MGNNDRDNNERREVTMHSAVCSKCKSDCEVPFKPTGAKPVLCRDCFSKGKPGGDRRGGDRRHNDRGPKPMGGGRSEHYDLEFEKLNNKLDKILARLTPVHTRSGIKKIEDMEETKEAEDNTDA